MEPMADISIGVREGFEKGKFRVGIRGKGPGTGQKRTRQDDNSDPDLDGKAMASSTSIGGVGTDELVVKKRKVKGPKGPNPLSIKKASKRKEVEKTPATAEEMPDVGSCEEKGENDSAAGSLDIIQIADDKSNSRTVKRKRKRKHKASKLLELLQNDVAGEDSG